MKGQARPSWSQGRHAWLSLLKLQGRTRPRGTSQGVVANFCRHLGWTSAGGGGHVLTAYGLEVLAAWDAGERGPGAAGAPLNLANVGPLATAEAIMAVGLPHARAVHDALARMLAAVATPVDPAPPPPPPRQQQQGTAPPDPEPGSTSRPPGHAWAGSLGTPVMPAGFSACLACSGRGKVRHGFQCQACHGSGRIRRTVEA